MSSLENLRSRLQQVAKAKGRDQDHPVAKQEPDTQDHTDSHGSNTAEFTEHTAWIVRIAQNGNKPEDWLEFTEFMKSHGMYANDTVRFTCLANIYAKAFMSIPYDVAKNNAAYAHMMVNCANLKSLYNPEDARIAFSNVRSSCKKFAFVHIAAAQFELSQGHRDKARKILLKARDIAAEPPELAGIAFKNLIHGSAQLLSEDEKTQIEAGILKDLNKENLPSPSELLQPKRSWLVDNKLDDPSPLHTRHDEPSVDMRTSHKRESPEYIVAPPGRHDTYTDIVRPLRGKSARTDSGSDDSCNLTTGQERVFAKPPLPPPSASRDRNVSGSQSDEGDTIPLLSMSQSSSGERRRVLRTCHSTPDCKTPGVLSGIHSANRKMSSKKPPLRVLKTSLPQLQEQKDSEEEEEVKVPPLPSMEDYAAAESSRDITIPDCASVDNDSGVHTEPMNMSSTSGMEPMETGADNLDSTNTSEPTCPTQIKANRSMHTQGHSATLVAKNTCNTKEMKAGTIKSQECPVKGLEHPVVHGAPQAQSQQVSSTSGLSVHVVPPGGSGMHLQPPPQQAMLPHMQGNYTPAKGMMMQQPGGMMMANTGGTGGMMMPGPTGMMMPNAMGQYPPHMFMCTPMGKQNEILSINQKMYTVLKVIGRGGFSKVYEVLDPDNNLRAVKAVNMDNANEAMINSYKNEIQLLQKLQHSERIIKLFDFEFHHENNMLYVVMERGDTDLASYFKTRSKHGSSNSRMRVFFWEEMLGAVQVLHDAGVIHSDLKPANFLLVAGNLKLIDFGIANSIQPDVTSITLDQQVGTLNYMSPEAITDTCGGTHVDERGKVKPKLKIGVQSDVWSLGCILYNLVYGRTPFQHITNNIGKLQAIINPNYCIEFSNCDDKDLLDVLKRCLVRDPKLRPSIEELLAHPYLQKR